MEQRQNEEVGEKLEITENTRWPVASSGTIPTPENPEYTRRGSHRFALVGGEQSNRSATVAPSIVDDVHDKGNGQFGNLQTGDEWFSAMKHGSIWIQTTAEFESVVVPANVVILASL
ncbi:hypothetical protein PR048_026177 [Dryococelus australis]|uniref:Uncharacterized protein n=1 Tax=Dryococelus australis TaxID=614101 RepID=A0ABQ9GKL0_9NEOP|nr:hypothetical protein PR048_026177 [Dryococelus australis]